MILLGFKVGRVAGGLNWVHGELLQLNLNFIIIKGSTPINDSLVEETKWKII